MTNTPLLFTRRFVRGVALALAILLSYDTAAVPLAQASVLGTKAPAPISRPAVSTAPTLSIDGEKGTTKAPSHRFSVPSTVGQIVQNHAPARAGRLVYHLQDVHGHVPAQANLSEMVSLLETHAAAQGKALLVAIEGASGRIDTDSIAALDIPAEQKASVAGGLLKSGFFFGEEHAAVLARPGRIRVVGIETPALYRRNIAAKADSSVSRARVLAAIRETRSQLETLAPHTFPAKLLDLERRRRDAEDGRGDLPSYAETLAAVVRPVSGRFPHVDRLVRSRRIEASIDFQKVERQRRLLVAEVAGGRSDRDVEEMVRQALALKDGRLSPLAYYRHLLSLSERLYPALVEYVAYLEQSSGIEADALLDEIHLLETEAADRLCATAEAHVLHEAMRWAERQERFFALEMTPSQWQRQKRESAASVVRTHAEIRSFLASQTQDLGYRFAAPLFSPADWRTAAAGAGGFYRAAEARDAAMVRNLAALLERHPETDFTVALVAGGFHTPGLTRLMEKRGLAYSVIRPMLESPVSLASAHPFPLYTQNVPADAPVTAGFLRATPGLALASPVDVARVFRRPGAALPSTREPAVTVYSPAWAGLFSFVFAIGDSPVILGTLCLAVGALVILGFQWVLARVRKAAEERAERRATERAESERIAAEQRAVLNAPTTDTILATARKRLVGGFTELPTYYVSYFIGLLSQIVDPKARPKPRLVTDRDVRNGNTILEALMTEDERIRLMKLIHYDDTDAEIDEALLREVEIDASLLAGGVGSNFGRLLYKTIRAAGRTGVHLPQALGEKGVDLEIDFILPHPRSGEPVTVSANIAEIKLLQLMLLRDSGIFRRVAYQPLVDDLSEVWYEKMLDSIYIHDRIDENIPPSKKRTYRAVMKEKGIVFSGYHKVHPFPGVDEETKMPGRPDEAPVQHGGHGQVGFYFLLEAMRKFGAPDQTGAKKSIRVFLNGDNVNARPDPRIVQHMVRNNHAVYMLVTPAQELDFKGGKLGVTEEVIGGHTYLIPNMVEAAQAKDVGQTAEFEGAGLVGGLGTPGTQSFNTNTVYMNEPLVGRILYRLAEHLVPVATGTEIDLEQERSEALARIIGPTLIGKKPVKGKDGRSYIPVEGAIGSLLLNLNRFFILNRDRAGIGNILIDEGFGRDDNLLNFVSIPEDKRTEQFTPNKVPTDQYLYANTDRFVFDPVRLIWVDRFKEKPLPIFDIPLASDPDGKFWADLQTLEDAFGRLSIADLSSFKLKGAAVMRNAVLRGRVEIRSDRPFDGTADSVVNLNNPVYRKKLKTTVIQTAEGPREVLLLENVRIQFDSSGHMSVEEIADAQPISVSGAVWAALAHAVAGLFAATGFLLAGEPTLAVIFVTGFSILSAFFAFVAAMGRHLVVGAAGVPGAATESDGNRLRQLRRLTAGLDVDVQVVPGVFAETVYDGRRARALNIGAGLVGVSAGPVARVIRAVLLHVAVAHERVHVSGFLHGSPATRAGFLRNEIIAWALTPLSAIFLLRFYFRSSAVAVGAGESHFAMSTAALADTPAKRTDSFVDAVSRSAKAGRRTATPRLIAVDAASFAREAGDPVALKKRLFDAARAAGALNRAIDGDGDVRATVIFFNTDPALAAVEADLRDAFAGAQPGFAVAFAGHAALSGWAGDADGLMKAARVQGQFGPDNIFLMRRAGAEGPALGVSVPVNNLLHLAVSMAVYSKSLDPQGVVEEIVRVLKDAKLNLLEDKLLDHAAQMLAAIAA